MKSNVLILGAGFGGLELRRCSRRSSATTSSVTLIDKSDAFVFGFSKLDVMFGRDDARRRSACPYRDIAKPGVRFVQETITAIDPDARRGDHRRRRPRGRRPGRRARRRLRPRRDARARAEAGNEFYSVAGRRAPRASVLADVRAGHGDRRRLRRAVQVPARAERGGAAAARLPRRARRPRRLRRSRS